MRLTLKGSLSGTNGETENDEAPDAYTEAGGGDGPGSDPGTGAAPTDGAGGGAPAGGAPAGGASADAGTGTGGSCAGKYGISDDEAIATNMEGVEHPYGTSPDGLARERAVRAAGGGGEAANPSMEGSNNAAAVPESCRDIPTTADDSYKVSKRFSVGGLSHCAAGSHNVGNGNTTYDPVAGRIRGFARAEIICNMRHLAINALEPIFDHFTSLGYRIVISSGFRRGVAKSDHTRGSAADLIFYYGNQRLAGSSLTRVMKAIDQVLKIPYTQMIFETPGVNGDIVHIACKRAGGNSGLRLCWSRDNGHGSKMSAGYKHTVSLEGSPPVKKA